ncbi:COP9 signalosome complex subunit 7 [Cyberlindnera fabianii]|uniref:COP9 signalosome complex subunit 7 n=1 Tax=Cyberlindnera fabianii TaxID=36022 RepID=A0A1V2LBC4_CYBFA|nr:COP9 signalosome complex subunit 7 [Cyberlindnera fabianii]
MAESIVASLEDSNIFGYNKIRLDDQFADIFKENERLKNTVELFCFGDYNHYITHKEKFISLSPSAVYKLKQLSLATEALKSSRLEYKFLQDKLDFGSKLDLEIFLTESVSAGVIDARLLGEDELVKVQASQGRDVLLDDEPEKESLTQEYGARCVSDLIRKLDDFTARIMSGYGYVSQIAGDTSSSSEEASQVAGSSVDLKPLQAETPAQSEDLSIEDETSTPSATVRSIDDSSSVDSLTSRKRKIESGK